MAKGKKTASATPRENSPSATARSKRSYLSQADVPGCVLDDALRVPRAIAENYAAKPTTPLNVAAALEMQPNAGRFRLLSGAAIAYRGHVGRSQCSGDLNHSAWDAHSTPNEGGR